MRPIMYYISFVSPGNILMPSYGYTTVKVRYYINSPWKHPDALHEVLVGVSILRHHLSRHVSSHTAQQFITFSNSITCSSFTTSHI